jgi:phosphohistidine phosphatase
MAADRERDDEDEEGGRRDRFIVLLRHGIAEDKTPEKSDEERSLTQEGHARMKQIARGLERAFPKAQAIYSSPLHRAVQTALWVSKGYRSRIKVSTTDALAPAATPKEFVEFVKGLTDRRVIVVGHEPNLSDNLSELLGFKGPFELKKGGGYGVRLRPDDTAQFEWLLSPRILRKLGEAD